jgi:hypothetical protein
MRKLPFIIVTLLLMTSACATSELQDTTVDQGGTITDLYYTMALDNLAMFRENPDSLPWHLKVASGTTQIADSASPSFNITWPHIARTLGLTASRSLTVQWSILPATDSTDLIQLKTTYQQYASVGPYSHQNFFNENFSEGSVPGGSPYGKYGSRYVWPLPGHSATLTQLVIDALGATSNLNKVQSIAFPGVTLTPTPVR